MKEATARIKINKLLEAVGWRFFADGNGPANIRLEPSVTIKSADLDVLGENFEKSEKGFVNFLLLDEKSFPLLVLEANFAESRSFTPESRRSASRPCANTRRSNAPCRRTTSRAFPSSRRGYAMCAYRPDRCSGIATRKKCVATASP
jgi:hypothetical protein